MPQTYPVSAIAQLLQISERRIQQLARDNILPRPIKGQYDAVQCVHGYIDYLKKLAMGNGELSLTDERTRLTKYQADLAEIELKKAHGELIQSKIAMAMWAEVITAVRQRLLGLPTRLAPIISTAQSMSEIKEKIDHGIHEVLNEFANPDFIQRASGGMENSLPSLEGLQAPTEAHSKRMGRQEKKTKS
jgi:hypothetical protein